MIIEENVVLVDEQNTEIGTARKESVHTINTPLHRGFSVFLFNSQREVLLTKRAKTKKTFPGIWTNSVCGHPIPDESVFDAAKRRLKEELGIEERDLQAIHSISRSTNTSKQVEIKEVALYRYRFADASGIVENEICPILVAKSDARIKPNPKEVEKWKWAMWKSFLDDIRKNPHIYSPWCIEEARILTSSQFQIPP